VRLDLLIQVAVMSYYQDLVPLLAQGAPEGFVERLLGGRIMT
jgi:hypothetical protein